jgi:hypothetical protein
MVLSDSLWAIVSNEVDNFLLTIDARPSEKTRKFSVIYFVYLKYCELNNLEPINKNTFGRVLIKKVKAEVSPHRHETRYYIDCELLNLKYEDKLALKEYKKEEALWLKEEKQRRDKQKEQRRKRRERKRNTKV